MTRPVQILGNPRWHRNGGAAPHPRRAPGDDDSRAPRHAVDDSHRGGNPPHQGGVDRQAQCNAGLHRLRGTSGPHGRGGRSKSVAGWKLARMTRPVQILGNLDGIETGVRHLIRDEPLETMTLEHRGTPLTIPTEAEILRIKGVLIVRRNATRDYIDFAALAALAARSTGCIGRKTGSLPCNSCRYSSPTHCLSTWKTPICPSTRTSLPGGMTGAR